MAQNCIFIPHAQRVIHCEFILGSPTFQKISSYCIGITENLGLLACVSSQPRRSYGNGQRLLENPEMCLLLMKILAVHVHLDLHNGLWDGLVRALRRRRFIFFWVLFGYFHIRYVILLWFCVSVGAWTLFPVCYCSTFVWDDVLSRVVTNTLVQNNGQIIKIWNVCDLLFWLLVMWIVDMWIYRYVYWIIDHLRKW